MSNERLSAASGCVGSVQLYQSKDGHAQLKVRTDGDTVWLTHQQMAALFGRDVKTIGKHVANAQREELAGMPVVTKFATTAADGKTYQVEYYNHDNALDALTLMISMREPKEKDVMIALITRIVSGNKPEMDV